MPYRQFKRPVLAVCASLFLSSAAYAQDAPDVDQVLATVNGTEITLGHLIVLRAGLPAQYDQVPAEVLFEGILNQLVQQTLLAQSLTTEPSRQTRILIENETRAITAGEAITNMIDRTISEETIQAAYETEYLGADPATEYSAAHILLQSQEEAQDIIAKLDEGAEFSALAREFSTGPSGPSGGELGWFGEGVMVAPFFEAVAALEPGQVSEPVQTDFGWHVILLKETRAKEVPELEVVRSEIETMLREQAMDEHLSQLEADGAVERIDMTDIDPELINNPALLDQ